MRRLCSINKQAISAAGNSQLPALNSCERFERRTGRAATIRAVTIEGISELVFYFVVDHAAQARAAQGAKAGCFDTTRHILKLLRQWPVVAMN
jgi:hypothetical protein